MNRKLIFALVLAFAVLLTSCSRTPLLTLDSAINVVAGTCKEFDQEINDDLGMALDPQGAISYVDQLLSQTRFKTLDQMRDDPRASQRVSFMDVPGTGYCWLVVIQESASENMNLVFETKWGQVVSLPSQDVQPVTSK